MHFYGVFAVTSAVLTVCILAQDQNYYFTGSQQQGRFIPNYQQNQNDYYQSIPFRQTAPGFQPHDGFLEQRDLQTSDVPRHLQQSLPQYQFSNLEPTSRFQIPSAKSNFPETLRFDNTGLSSAQQSRVPTPFRGSQSLPSSFAEIIPSTHRPHYLPHSSRNHDPSTETFLGEITLQNPVVPDDFNNNNNNNNNKNAPKFRPSSSFSYQTNNHRLPEELTPPTPRQNKWQNIDNSLSKTKNNDISRRPDSNEQDLSDEKRTRYNNVPPTGNNNNNNNNNNNYLSHRTRTFAPTNSQENRGNKLQNNDYFINSNGDVFNSSPRSRTTTPRTTTAAIPITTLSRRNPFVFTSRTTVKPSTTAENKIAFIQRRPTASTVTSTTTAPTTTTTTKSSIDLDSLLEEPLDKDSIGSNDDDVEVIEDTKHKSNLTETEEDGKLSQTDEEEALEHNEEYDYQLDDDEHKEDNDEENNINSEDANSASLDEESLTKEDHDSASATDKPENSSYEVLTMKPSSMVKDDNFREFVDTTVIDNTEEPDIATTTTSDDLEETTSRMAVSVSTSVHSEQSPPAPSKVDPVLIGGAVVSVVTTKSVVNGTLPMPVTQTPNDTEQLSPLTMGNSTESWVVVASVQTSRSVSGARYLPFPVVEQEQRTKILKEQSDEDNDASVTDSSIVDDDVTAEITTDTPEELTTLVTIVKGNQSSTESIIDKLDRVQSELSSGFLTGGFNNVVNNIAVITEGMNDKAEDVTTTTTTTTEKQFVLPPVVIRKFSANARPSSTPRPKKQYKFTTPTTTTTTQQSAEELPQGDAPVNKVVVQDVSAFLPPGYNLKKEDTTETAKPIEEILKKIKFQDPSSLLPPGFKSTNVAKEDPLAALLPPGYKPPASTEKSKLETHPVFDISALLPPGYKLTTEKPTTEKPKPLGGALAKAQPVDISAFLPPGYKPPKETDEATQKPVKTSSDLFANAKPVDLSALLPPGYKPPSSGASTTAKPKSVVPSLLDTAKEEDISAFLPPGYKSKYLVKSTITTTTTTTEATKSVHVLSEGEKIDDNSNSKTTTPTSGGGFKVVFPSRPGRKPGQRITTPRTASADSPPSAVTPPAILKGWPSRATTEFTGWPTPSTTPISIEKLLEAARIASATSSTSSPSTSTSTTTTTTTTTTTIKPTTPGICRSECDLAATIKLVGGAKWVPELLDQNTQEWQILANEVQTQLEDVFTKSNVLSKWYTKIRIDGFSEGSVLVDYFVELNDLGRQVDTMEFKKLFHESLHAAGTTTPSSREAKSTDYTNNTIPEDNKPKLGLGNFLVDPMYTDFIVIPKQIVPTVGYAEDNVLLPQWAIAVIVIGLASLMFVIIFGVTVLVNRQKNAKKKQPIPLTEDMLNELNKNHMGGIDNFGAEDLYNMEDVWNERAYESSKLPKKRSTGSIHDNSMSNLYDSWKSEWNGYYYNAYYGNNPGSSHSGYSRRRSDYDTNF